MMNSPCSGGSYPYTDSGSDSNHDQESSSHSPVGSDPDPVFGYTFHSSDLCSDDTNLAKEAGINFDFEFGVNGLNLDQLVEELRQPESLDFLRHDVDYFNVNSTTVGSSLINVPVACEQQEGMGRDCLTPTTSTLSPTILCSPNTTTSFNIDTMAANAPASSWMQYETALELGHDVDMSEANQQTDTSDLQRNIDEAVRFLGTSVSSQPQNSSRVNQNLTDTPSGMQIDDRSQFLNDQIQRIVFTQPTEVNAEQLSKVITTDAPSVRPSGSQVVIRDRQGNCIGQLPVRLIPDPLDPSKTVISFTDNQEAHALSTPKAPTGVAKSLALPAAATPAIKPVKSAKRHCKTLVTSPYPDIKPRTSSDSSQSDEPLVVSQVLPFTFPAQPRYTTPQVISVPASPFKPEPRSTQSVSCTTHSNLVALSLSAPVVVTSSHHGSLLHSQPLHTTALLKLASPKIETESHKVDFGMINGNLTAIISKPPPRNPITAIPSNIVPITFAQQVPLAADYGLQHNTSTTEQLLSYSNQYAESMNGIDESSLSPDELCMLKRQQRMIRNREAASQSRMRKKQHVVELEQNSKRLTRDNNILTNENKILKQRNQCLTNENAELRRHLVKLTTSMKGAVSDSRRNSASAVAPTTKENLLSRVRSGRVIKGVGKAAVCLFALSVLCVLNIPQFKIFAPLRNSADSGGGSNNPVSSLSQQLDTYERNPNLVPQFHSRSLMSVSNSKNSGESDGRMVRHSTGNDVVMNETVSADCDYGRHRFMNSTEALRLTDQLNSWVQQHERDRTSRLLIKQTQRVQQSKEQLSKHTRGFMSHTAAPPAHSRQGLGNQQQRRKLTGSLAKGNPVGAAPKPYLAFRDAFGPQFRRPSIKQMLGGSGGALTMYQSIERQQEFKEFLKAFHPREDMFYLVAWHGDYVVLPAINANRTSPPRFALLMPTAKVNDTKSKGSADVVSMMQINCDVVSTESINLPESVVSSFVWNQQPPLTLEQELLLKLDNSTITNYSSNGNAVNSSSSGNSSKSQNKYTIDGKKMQ